MSARVDSFSRLPKRLIIILLLCTCIMLGHILAEGLLPHYSQPGLDSRQLPEKESLDLSDYQDDFLFTLPNLATDELTTATISREEITGAFSFSVLPILPPPNK